MDELDRDWCERTRYVAAMAPILLPVGFTRRQINTLAEMLVFRMKKDRQAIVGVL